jgi:hypothetical protein
MKKQRKKTKISTESAHDGARGLSFCLLSNSIPSSSNLRQADKVHNDSEFRHY